MARAEGSSLEQAFGLRPRRPIPAGQSKGARLEESQAVSKPSACDKAEANRTTGGLTKAACRPRDDIRAGIGAKRRERHGYPLAGERLCPAPFLYIKEGVGKQASAPSMQTERSDKLREVEGEGAVECF